MDQQNFKKLLDKYIKGVASTQEEEKLNTFFSAMQTPGKMWSELGLSDKQAMQKEIWQNIEPSRKPFKITKRYKIALRIAAFIILLISIGTGFNRWLKNNTPQEHWVCIKTNPGEKRTIVLSDSTMVTLNASSELQYTKPFSPQTRHVKLSGEAFFQVSKDPHRPFIVSSNKITTTVLGTSFNVHAYPHEDAEVSVSTGKVKVSLSEQKECFAILLPGEQASFSEKNNLITKHIVNINDCIGWQHNQLVFHQKSLAEILMILERTYNVKINCSNHKLLSKSITSQYSNETLINIMDDLKYMLDFSYTITQENNIQIE